MRRLWCAILMAAPAAAAGAGSTYLARQERSSTVDPRLMTVLAAEENRAATEQQLRDLAEAIRADSPSVQAAAARALGRLERRDVIPLLLPLLSALDEAVRSEAANAIAQAFRGETLPSSTSAEQVQAALDALLAAQPADGLYRAVGRLPYEHVSQVRAAESFLLRALGASTPPPAAARAIESLARLRPRLAPLDGATIDRLRQIAARRGERTHPADVRRNAMLALVAWQGVDAATVHAALHDEEFGIRRLAALALAGAGSAFTSEERVSFLTLLLHDRAPQVRLEAVRAWARRVSEEAGCVILLSMLGDSDLHVVLAALDSLGDHCKDDEEITDLIASEARTPPTEGPWQREAHAFVALAKRSPERAAIAMSSFAMHNDWQVRLYAARAAVAMNDVETLRRLAADVHDNVVEATLAPLRKRLGAASDSIFIAALDRRTHTTDRNVPARPYQVYREAALQLEGADASPDLLAAVVAALQRVTTDRCHTSRDTRLALIDRIVEFGSGAQASALTPLLRDIDPRIAEAAAEGIATWTSRRPVIQPEVRQPELPAVESLLDSPLVVVEMEGGREFRMAFYAEQAPLTKARFLRLVRERYYDGLTFHRIVPTFVIQGGSPNANEYCGDCPFMRDEVGLLMNLRGTVGVSTRGRDTGDAQFFVNLVDTPRLDHQYTVFAYVCPRDMGVVDWIQEGDRMQRVRLHSRMDVHCPAPR